MSEVWYRGRLVNVRGSGLAALSLSGSLPERPHPLRCGRRSPLKCQAFYSYRNGALGQMKNKTISALQEERITILSDEQLLSGCLVSVIECAVWKARNDRLKLL